MSKSPPPALTHTETWWCHWCTAVSMTAWSRLAHSVMQSLSPRYYYYYHMRTESEELGVTRCAAKQRVLMGYFWYQSCMFCTPCLAVFPTHFNQLDLNAANLKATVEAEWILAFLFLLAKMAFFIDVTITSSLRSVVPVLMGHFYNFSVSWIVRMIRAKNYEKLSKFVKVTAKILSVPFFRTRCTCHFSPVIWCCWLGLSKSCSRTSHCVHSSNILRNTITTFQST